MGDQAPRKDDGTDLGCVWIQSNGLIALEIKCCCMRFVNSCSTVLILGVGRGFLTNLLLLPETSCQRACGVVSINTINDGNAIRHLLLLQYPQFTRPLNLMRVLCVFLALGKLGFGEVLSSFVERRPA